MFDNFGYYMSTAMKDWKAIKAMETTSPKMYGQYLQQKKTWKQKTQKTCKRKVGATWQNAEIA